MMEVSLRKNDLNSTGYKVQGEFECALIPKLLGINHCYSFVLRRRRNTVDPISRTSGVNLQSCIPLDKVFI